MVFRREIRCLIIILLGKETCMKTLAFLSGVIASHTLQAQEANRLLRYWNAPAEVVVPAETHSEAKPWVILVHEASEFPLPPSSKLVYGHHRENGGLGFILNVGDKTNWVSFDPADNQKGGKFTVLKSVCGGPTYELVPGSDAEKNLLKFLRHAYQARLNQPMAPSTDDKCGCENRARKTLEALALLVGYFPDEGAER